MAVLNSTVLDAVWLSATNDYQQRIPNAAQQGYANAVKELFAPYNNDLYNQFTGLLGGVMGTYIEGKTFYNPLRVLKKPSDGELFGQVERHIAVKYLNAHTYRADSETLLKYEPAEYVEWFYSVGEPRRYDFSWPRYDMRRAFAADGYGFSDLLERTLGQQISSDEYDEMIIMIQMFAEAEARLPGGIFKRQVSAVSDKATGQALLAQLRADAGRMAFPSRLFNHIDVPVYENADTLVLWCTPEVRAFLDVYALADLFNMEQAEVKYRVIEIPEFPIPNVVAALTSEDFIYARDAYYSVEPPFANPENLSLKFYLHHSEIIGINPAANAILYTTGAATSTPTLTMSLTGAAFTPDTGTVAPGGILPLNFALAGSITGNDAGVAVEPDSATYEVAASRDSAAIPLNSRTFVDKLGRLHVQKSGLEADDVITVIGTATYVNPSGSTSTYTDTFTATIVAPAAQGVKESVIDTAPYGAMAKGPAEVLGVTTVEDGAITSAKLANNAVTGDKLASGAVDTAQLADGAVTADKIDAKAVTTTKIADEAVGTDQIADGAVTAQKLAQ